MRPLVLSATQTLRDPYDRVATDLRVSLTDRCNLRCSYCMPADGLDWLPTEETLTTAEVCRLIRIAVEMLGVRTVRFTGGEPLLRRDLEQILGHTAALRCPDRTRPDLALTTNGLGLDKRATGLVAAGLNRVNVSLDSLDPQRYAAIARRPRLHDALAGLTAARTAGLHPIKVNAVAMRGMNEDDIVPLAEFSLRHGFELRFIEHMPLGPGHGWDRAAMVPAAEILGRLEERFTLTPRPTRGNAPAEVWDVAAGADHPAGGIGVIASVTRPFCTDCNRTRLTSDGQMRTCLFSRTETDLRTPLRAGASDDEIAARWQQAHRDKPAAHGIDDPGFTPPERPMSSIGG
ncbi:MAG: GTP 3',8-cyclase MoaA [Propioniciclava sp.]